MILALASSPPGRITLSRRQVAVDHTLFMWAAASRFGQAVAQLAHLSRPQRALLA